MVKTTGTKERAKETAAAVENDPTPPPSPSPQKTARSAAQAVRPDRATAADRASANEANALRATAAKAAAELARVTAELEREKRKNLASKAATPVTSPAPTSTSGKPKKSAATIRREQVLSETLTFHVFETLMFFLYLCRCRYRNRVAAAMTNW